MEEQGQATVRAPSAAFSIEAILRSGVMGAGRQEAAGALEAAPCQQVKREVGEGAGEGHGQVGCTAGLNLASLAWLSLCQQEY